MLVSRGKPFNVRKATTDHWYNVAVGRSDAHISIDLVNKDDLVCLNFYIPDNKNLFDSLYAHKEEIESELGFEMEWDRLDGKKAARIKHNIKGLNFDDHSNYDALMNEIIDISVKMRNVFKRFI